MLYQEIASTVSALRNCIKSNNVEWISNHSDKLNNELGCLLPSGSGFNSGSCVNQEKSTSEKIVINSGFHTMDEMGGYDTWIDFSIIITPSLQFGFDLKIKNISDHYRWKKYALADYIYETFDHALRQ